MTGGRRRGYVTLGDFPDPLADKRYPAALIAFIYLDLPPWAVWATVVRDLDHFPVDTEYKAPTRP
jgi:hypothetical protein